MNTDFLGFHTPEHIHPSPGRSGSLTRSRHLLTCDGRQRLSQLWSEAAAKARYASKELAERLQNKSVYWSEDLKWSREEVLSKQIDIDSIQEQVLVLLRK